jgi:hypothetical protein
MVSGIANKESVENERAEEEHLPSLEVAEARIAQALIRYQVKVAKKVLAEEQEKVRP